MFRVKYEEIASSDTSSADSDKVNFPILSFFKYGKTWLTPRSCNAEHEWNMSRCEESLMNLHGFDVSGPRDWNEEL